VSARVLRDMGTPNCLSRTITVRVGGGEGLDPFRLREVGHEARVLVERADVRFGDVRSEIEQVGVQRLLVARVRWEP